MHIYLLQKDDSDVLHMCSPAWLFLDDLHAFWMVFGSSKLWPQTGIPGVGLLKAPFCTLRRVHVHVHASHEHYENRDSTNPCDRLISSLWWFSVPLLGSNKINNTWHDVWIAGL
jgi:hypothetical protein